MASLTNFQSVLADQIKGLVEASDEAASTSIDLALAAGHKLIEAKADCGHGHWLPFLARAGVPERKAQRLMALARTGLKSDSVTDLGGIGAALTFASKRSQGVDLLNSVEFDGWADWLDTATPDSDMPAVAVRVLERDLDRLMTAMQIMQECHDMFAPKAAA